MTSLKNFSILLLVAVPLVLSKKEGWVGYLKDPLTPGEIRLEQPPLGAHQKLSTAEMVTEGLVNSTHFLVQFPSVGRWFYLPRVLAPPPLPPSVTVVHSHALVLDSRDKVSSVRGPNSLFLPSTEALRFFPFSPQLTSSPQLIPPISCQLTENPQLVPGVLRVWGPPAHSSTLEGTLVTCKTKSENCTKYFFGAEQISLDWDKPTSCNQFHKSLISQHKSKLKTEQTLTIPLVQAPCLWTGTQTKSEDYLFSQRVKVILSADGYVSYPPGFSLCRAFNDSACSSSFQVLMLDHLIDDPSSCKSLEVKLISKSFVQVDRTKNGTLHLIGIKDPQHQLGFSLEGAKKVCTKEGHQYTHQLLLTKSSYLISLFLLPDNSTTLNISNTPNVVRDLPEDLTYWKDLKSKNQPSPSSHHSISMAIHQWKLHHKIPLRTHYSESEMIYGLSELSEKTSRAMYALFSELCRMSSQIWKLAFQSWTLNPTLMAQVLTKDPTVIGENRAGRLIIHHSLPSGPILIPKDTTCRGDWMFVQMFNVTDQTYAPVWLQKVSGFIVPFTPKIPISVHPENFLIPFNQTHFFDILQKDFLMSLPQNTFKWNHTLPFFSSDLTLERSEITSLEYVSRILDEISLPPTSNDLPQKKDRDQGVDISRHWKNFADWISDFFLSWRVVVFFIIVFILYALFRVGKRALTCCTGKEVPPPPASPLHGPWFSTGRQASPV